MTIVALKKEKLEYRLEIQTIMLKREKFASFLVFMLKLTNASCKGVGFR